MLHPTHYTLGLQVFPISLSRSSGAILLFELALPWRLVHLRYVIGGLVEGICHLSLYPPCHAHILFFISKERQKEGSKEKKIIRKEKKEVEKL